MSVSSLVDALKHLREIFSAGGAAAQAKELGLLIDAIAPCEGLSVEQLLAEFESASKSKPKEASKPPKVIDQLIVQRYLQSLKNAEDVDEVVAVISIMKHDKVDKDHVSQIAAQFTGGEPHFKSLGEAFARIRGAFIEQKRFENKLKAAHLD